VTPILAGNSLAINTYFIERENMKIKTDVKASATTGNVGRASSRNRTGLKVKTGIKAGPPDTPIVRG
jgi:hypothetical protein